MNKLREYGWVLKGLAAFVLIAASIYMIVTYNKEDIVFKENLIRLIGFTILVFALIRLKPILTGEKDRQYIIVMYSELLISVIIGILFLTIPSIMESVFSYLVGGIMYARGVIYFWTIVKKYDISDMFAFVAHILFISFGFLLFFKPITIENIITLIIILAILLGLAFGYSTYTGYNNFRLHKDNTIKMNKYKKGKSKDDEVFEIKDKPIIHDKGNIDEPTRESDVVN